MKTVTKFSKRMEDFLHDNGNCVEIHQSPHQSEVYYFLPFWFQKWDDDGGYALHGLGNLPPSLEKHIKAMRHDKKEA